MIKTFKEWSRAGYSIKKGSKSIGKNKTGEYLFSSEQVTENLKFEENSIDYTDSAEFWASANPQALYWYTVKHPEKKISKRAGCILAKNLK